LKSWDYELDYTDFESQQGQLRYLFLKGPDWLRAHSSLLYNKHQSSISGVRRPSLEATTPLHIYAFMPCIRTILPFTVCLHAVTTNMCNNLESFPLEELCKADPVLSINLPCTNKAVSTGNKKGLYFAKILSFQSKPKYPCCTEEAEYN
jgi:hypothetical protein